MIEATLSAEAQPPVGRLEATLAAERTALLQLAFRITKSRMDAEDAFQSAAIHALERARGPECIASWPAWLSIVVRRSAIDLVRRRLRWADSDIPAAELPSAQPGLSGASRELSAEHLQTALASCDPAQRMTFELWVVHGLSYKQIAARVGVPVSTVATRLYRARQHLRAQLSWSAHDSA